TNGIPASRVMWEVEPRERQRHMIIEKRHLNGSRMTRW
nr:hypothetical protein [Tanacetum cinerariifolium]